MHLIQIQEMQQQECSAEQNASQHLTHALDLETENGALLATIADLKVFIVVIYTSLNLLSYLLLYCRSR